MSFQPPSIQLPIIPEVSVTPQMHLSDLRKRDANGEVVVKRKRQKSRKKRSANEATTGRVEKMQSKSTSTKSKRKHRKKRKAHAAAALQAELQQTKEKLQVLERTQSESNKRWEENEKFEGLQREFEVLAGVGSPKSPLRSPDHKAYDAPVPQCWSKNMHAAKTYGNKEPGKQASEPVQGFSMGLLARSKCTLSKVLHRSIPHVYNICRSPIPMTYCTWGNSFQSKVMGSQLIIA
jgi:hypothetical protein